MNISLDGAQSVPGCGVMSFLIGAAICGMAASPAAAFFFATRFVERIGGTDVVLADGPTFLAGTSHRLRVQVGVFDDDNGPAPAGGVAGWNEGMFAANFGSWTRTPGRLAPFNSSPFPYSNGVPETDPFTSLEQIDNVVLIQTPAWLCGPDGNPLPRPEATIYGLNRFVSTFEATVQIPAGLEGTFQVTVGGHWVALAAWEFHPELSFPPDCETGEPGTAFYAALPGGANTQGEFTNELRVNVVIPGPTGAMILVSAAVLGGSRRRGAGGLCAAVNPMT